MVGCQFVEFLMDSDEVREVRMYTHKFMFYLFSGFLIASPVRALSLSSSTLSTGWPGLPGGAGEGHGVMAVLVLRTKTRALSAEQRPAHHTQPTLLPLPGDALCSPAGSQTAGEMWPVSVVSLKKTNVCSNELSCFIKSTTLVFFSQPAESVLCEEPGRCAETCCIHTGLQQRRSGQSHPLQDPHCCY